MSLTIGDVDLLLKGPGFLTAPVDGDGLIDDGIAGLEGGTDRRGGVVGRRRDGVAGGVTWPAGMGVKISRKSLMDEDSGAGRPLKEFSAAILLLFAALALPFRAFDFLFLPCTFLTMSYLF